MLFFFNPNFATIKLRHVLLNDFCEKGIDVAIALPQEHISFWKERCPKVRFIPFDTFNGTSIGVLNNIKTLLAIRKLLKTEKPDSVFLGEIALNGQIRSVINIEKRLKENGKKCIIIL